MKKRDAEFKDLLQLQKPLKGNPLIGLQEEVEVINNELPTKVLLAVPMAILAAADRFHFSLNGSGSRRG